MVERLRRYLTHMRYVDAEEKLHACRMSPHPSHCVSSAQVRASGICSSVTVGGSEKTSEYLPSVTTATITGRGVTHSRSNAALSVHFPWSGLKNSQDRVYHVLSALAIRRASNSLCGNGLVRGKWRPSWYPRRMPIPSLTHELASVGSFQHTRRMRLWIRPMSHCPRPTARSMIALAWARIGR